MLNSKIRRVVLATLCALLFVSPVAAAVFEGLSARLVPASGGVAYNVFLTFDDGPSPITEDVLDVLAREQVYATFFVIGVETKQGVSLYGRILDEGHSLGLHTYSHNVKKIYASLEGFKQDFNKLGQWLCDTTGITPKVCRMAGGSNSAYCPAYLREQILTYLVEEGYSCFDWDIDARDSGPYTVSAGRLAGNVIAAAKKKPNQDLIILLHDDRMRTSLPEALPLIIAYFREAGYNFKALWEDVESAKRILPNSLKNANLFE